VKLPQGTAWRGPNPTVYLRDRKGRWVRIRPAGRESLIVNKADGAWHTISVPLRPDPKWERFVFDSEPTDGVDWIEIAFNGGAAVGVAHSVQLDGVRMLPESPAYAPPDEDLADLDVLIVERSPLYERYNMPEYDPKKEIGVPKNARAKHEPSPGERVTFTATVQNKGRTAAGAAYEWRMDGRVIGRGTLKPLPPRARATATMEWRWDPGDHDLTFALVSAKPDSCPANDALTIRTNALMLKFQIERGLVARMESKTNMKGSYSCEDWLQGQLEYMNQLFRISTYPFAPNGITQRVMVGKFDYVDDGYLLTLGAGPYKVGELDWTLDGGRGCTALDDPWKAGAGAPSFLNFIGRPDDAWLHELGHQIGVIDDYQFITEPEANKVNGVGFNYRGRGLMGGGEVGPHKAPDTLYSYYSPSDVMGLNATKGKRRGFFGEYLFCMPARCALRIEDEGGKPIADAEVRVYETEDRTIDQTPEHTGRTDARGVIALANQPIPGGPLTTATGCTLHDNPFGFIHVVGFNGVFLVVVRHEGRELYGFTSVPEFNVAWASGARDSAEIPVTVKAKGDERWGYGRM
jgi:hypothetical protein